MSRPQGTGELSELTNLSALRRPGQVQAAPTNPRDDEPDSWHHVTNRGVRKQPIFAAERDRAVFLRFLAEASARYGLEANAYCLLDNHFHLLINSLDARLSQGIRALDANYARYFNRTYGFSGAAFQSRFFSERLRTDESVLNTGRYIHLNPVEAGIADKPAGYTWSSYGAYLGTRPTPRWLHTRITLGLAGGPTAYASFVEGNSASVRLDASPRSPRWLETDLLLEIDRRLAALESVDPGSIVISEPGKANPVRSAALVLAADSTTITVQEIATHYGSNSIASIRRSIRRARVTARKPGPLRDILHRYANDRGPQEMSSEHRPVRICATRTGSA